MTAALLTGPALEPVSLAEAKAHLRLDTDDDDQLVTAAIVAARVHVEAATRRALIEQSWRVYLDAWPRKRIVPIPVAPLIAVDAVTVYNSEGDPVTVDPDDYEIDTVAVPGRLVLSTPIPQIVVAVILMTASPGPGDGFGTRSTAIRSLPLKTTAVIVSAIAISQPFGGPNLQVRPQRADLKVRPSERRRRRHHATIATNRSATRRANSGSFT